MRFLSFKTLAHGVMVAFALASLGNVHEFFANAGHDGFAAWSLAVALGAALVTISIMLTHVDRDSDRQAWATLAFVGVAVGILSGSLQTSTYMQTLQTIPAALLGYGIPLIGEVALAFGVAAYEKAEARAAYRNVGVLVEGAVAAQLESAISSFDGMAIQRHVETTINRLAKQSVTHVSNEAMSYYLPDNQNSFAVQNEPSEYVQPDTVSRPENTVRVVPQTVPQEEKQPIQDDSGIRDTLFGILDREQSGDLPKQKRSGDGGLPEQLGISRTKMYELIAEWKNQQPQISTEAFTPEVYTNGVG